MSDSDFLDTAADKLAISQMPGEDRYVLRLFVSGTTSLSTQAILNIKGICEEYLKDRYDLEVIDLYQQPQMTRTEQIYAAPTLIKSFPLPQRKLIGNLSDVDRVLAMLDLPRRG